MAIIGALVDYLVVDTKAFIAGLKRAEARMPTKARVHGQADAQQRRAQRDRWYDARRALDPKLGRAKQIRDSVQWQRFRAWYKGKHPLCCDPFNVHGPMAVVDEVHHIEQLQDRPDLAFAEGNCASLCSACHARVSAMERRGEDSRGLFGVRG